MVQRDRVRAVYDITHTHPHPIQQWQTRVWNAAGVAPPHLDPLGPDVWVGDHALPRAARAHHTRRTLGSLEYVAEQVEHTTRSDHAS